MWITQEVYPGWERGIPWVGERLRRGIPWWERLRREVYPRWYIASPTMVGYLPTLYICLPPYPVRGVHASLCTCRPVYTLYMQCWLDEVSSVVRPSAHRWVLPLRKEASLPSENNLLLARNRPERAKKPATESTFVQGEPECPYPSRSVLPPPSVL